jgi:hypothetical protein
MGNIFSQQGLGSMLQAQLSEREKQALNRQQVQAQIDEQRAKSAQYADPKYLESQLPPDILNYKFFAGLSPTEQELYLKRKRATAEEALMRKGVTIDPVTGQAMPLSGYADTLAMEEAAKKKAVLDATSRAGRESDLNERLSMLPELEQTVKELDKLGQKATYTKAGQLKDFLAKEMGAEEGEGAIARAGYTAMVDNQVLPLLRQTFGAAFTAAEGDRLRETLGDPNKSPKAKKFVLDTFIRQKQKDIKSLQRGLNNSDRPLVSGSAQSDVISFEEYFK